MIPRLVVRMLIATTVYAAASLNSKVTHTGVADPNVFLTRTVIEIEHASEVNAEIRVLELVLLTRCARLTVTYQCAVVHRECKEMHLFNANNYKSQYYEIHAILLRVDRTVSVVKSTGKECVHVCPDLLEVLQHADQNVFKIMNVHSIKPVPTRSVETPASEHVVLGLFALLSITVRFVGVQNDWKVILSSDVSLRVNNKHNS